MREILIPKNGLYFPVKIVPVSHEDRSVPNGAEFRHIIVPNEKIRGIPGQEIIPYGFSIEIHQEFPNEGLLRDISQRSERGRELLEGVLSVVEAKRNELGTPLIFIGNISYGCFEDLGYGSLRMNVRGASRSAQQKVL